MKSSIPPLYRTLGLEPEAKIEDIKAAYRRLAKKSHPDANPDKPNSDELFKRVAEAYRILIDPASRNRYDVATGVKVSSKEEQRRAASSETGYREDVHIRLHLTLEQAWRGGRKELKFPRNTPCSICEGSGLDDRGRRCEKCNGTGVFRKNVSVDVEYPPGVRPGSTLRFAAFGHRLPPGYHSGDLLVEILYKANAYLDVQGSDLHYRALIGLDLFIEGGNIVVPTPSGALSVAIPPRMSDGRVLKLAGKGLPPFQKEKSGDMIVRIELCVPKRLSRKEKQMLKELMSLPGFQPPVDASGFIPNGD